MWKDYLREGGNRLWVMVMFISIITLSIMISTKPLFHNSKVTTDTLWRIPPQGIIRNYKDTADPFEYLWILNELPIRIQKLVYGFATSPIGYAFLRNFVQGSQELRFGDKRAITIKGNGNNFNLNYNFYHGRTDVGERTNELGITLWGLGQTPYVNVYTDIKNQSFEDQVITFGHENLLHARNDVAELVKYRPKGFSTQLIDAINSDGYKDHKRYTNKNSLERKLMKEFLEHIKHWVGYGQEVSNEQLDKAFEKDYSKYK